MIDDAHEPANDTCNEIGLTEPVPDCRLWLAHWPELLRAAEEDLEAVTSGQWQVGENRGEGWVDITAKWTERLRSEVAAIENLIASYERTEFADCSTLPDDDPFEERDVFPE